MELCLLRKPVTKIHMKRKTCVRALTVQGLSTTSLSAAHKAGGSEVFKQAGQRSMPVHRNGSELAWSKLTLLLRQGRLEQEHPTSWMHSLTASEKLPWVSADVNTPLGVVWLSTTCQMSPS